MQENAQKSRKPRWSKSGEKNIKSPPYPKADVIKNLMNTPADVIAEDGTALWKTRNLCAVTGLDRKYAEKLQVHGNIQGVKIGRFRYYTEKEILWAVEWATSPCFQRGRPRKGQSDAIQDTRINRVGLTPGELKSVKTAYYAKSLLTFAGVKSVVVKTKKMNHPVLEIFKGRASTDSNLVQVVHFYSDGSAKAASRRSSSSETLAMQSITNIREFVDEVKGSRK